MRMKLKLPLLALAMLATVTGAADAVVIENAAFRLVISQDGAATSLVVKATGEECLAPGVRIPFARLRQRIGCRKDNGCNDDGERTQCA